MIGHYLLLICYMSLLFESLYFKYFLYRKLGLEMFSIAPWPRWIWYEYFVRDWGGCMLLVSILLGVVGKILIDREEKASKEKFKRIKEDVLRKYGKSSK